MLIGELAARTGASQRSLRYYEQQGLLQVRRGSNGYRSYDTESVRIVLRIRSLLGAGLSTEVIRSVLPCVAAGEVLELDLCPELVRTLQRELDQLDARIDAMQHSRGTLAAYLS